MYFRICVVYWRETVNDFLNGQVFVNKCNWTRTDQVDSLGKGKYIVWMIFRVLL